MLSKKGVFSAMVGVAMLAMPASALAGHHDHDFKARPYAEHDQGWHNGWSKHEREHEGFRLGSRYYQPSVRNVPPPHTVYWHPEPDRDEYSPAPRPAWHHHEPDADDYPSRACDEDGDNCGGQWGGYNYGQPLSYYNGVPPGGLQSFTASELALAASSAGLRSACEDAGAARPQRRESDADRDQQSQRANLRT